MVDLPEIEIEILDALAVGVCVWELREPGEAASLVLRVCNPAAARFLGVEVDAVLGKAIAEGFPGSLDTPMPGVFTRVIESGEMADLGDVPYSDGVVADGVFSIRVMPLSDRRALVEFTNVTEERRAQAEMQSTLDAAHALDDKLAQIEAQKREIQRLTAPILELWSGVLALPLVGHFDLERAEVVREKLLARVVERQAAAVVIDVTGLASIDEAIADELIRLERALGLLGVRTYFTGISPGNALTMSKLDATLGGRCLRNLEEALRTLVTVGEARRA